MVASFAGTSDKVGERGPSCCLYVQLRVFMTLCRFSRTPLIDTSFVKNVRGAETVWGPGALADRPRMHGYQGARSALLASNHRLIHNYGALRRPLRAPASRSVNASVGGTSEQVGECLRGI